MGSDIQMGPYLLYLIDSSSTPTPPLIGVLTQLLFLTQPCLSGCEWWAVVRRVVIGRSCGQYTRLRLVQRQRTTKIKQALNSRYRFDA
jgi:hypothetical protein